MGQNGIYLLTQDNCGHCKQVEMFINKALKPEQQEMIHEVHRQSVPEDFDKFVEEYGIKQTPALIVDGQAYLKVSPIIIKDALKKAM